MKTQHTDNTGRLATLIGLAAFLLAVVFGFVGVAVWWVQSNWGANAALLMLGGGVGILSFAGGAMFAHRQNRRTMEASADMIASVTDSFRASAGVQREIARGQTAWQVAGAKAQLVDYQADRRDEDRRVRLLVDAERQKMQQEFAASMAAQPQAAPAWVGVDDESGGGFRFSD